MKYQLDIKSILIGFLGAGLLIATFSFKGTQQEWAGRYQTAAGETGVVILDTQTGAYILTDNMYNNEWQKVEFSKIYSISKGNKKVDSSR